MNDEPELVPARSIQVGDMLDLEGDRYADAPGSEVLNSFEFELALVTEVEVETTDCVRIGGPGFCVGFPIDHMLKRMGHDDSVESEA
jgi:hypothetical protein